jgi:hypothetical protein
MPEHQPDKLIGPGNLPAGCTTMTLRYSDGDERALAARDATDETPEPAGEHQATCTSTLQVLRFPTTGLNLPGEASPVGVMVWCQEHGTVDQRFDEPTAQERAWNWHLPAV